jgi:hypothetical protein
VPNPLDNSISDLYTIPKAASDSSSSASLNPDGKYYRQLRNILSEKSMNFSAEGRRSASLNVVSIARNRLAILNKNHVVHSNISSFSLLYISGIVR